MKWLAQMGGSSTTSISFDPILSVEMFALRGSGRLFLET
jgi:hypothetical protein